MKRVILYLRYLWHITEGFHGAIALRSVLGVIRVAAMMAFIWLSKTAIDVATGTSAEPAGSLLTWFVLMVACMLTEVGIAQWVKYIVSRADVLMNIRVNRRLFNVLMSMPPDRGRYTFHSGDMLDRLTLDVATVSDFALYQLPGMFVLGVQIVAAFVFLACLNPYLALAPFVIMPVCLVAGKMYFRRHRRLTAEIRRSQSTMHVSMQEGLKHRTVLRSLECEDELDRRIGSIQQNIDDANRRQTRLSTVSSSMTRVGFTLGYLTAFGWGIFSLRAGVITFGTMSAFLQLVNRIQHPIAGITGYLPAFIATSVAIDRLREIDIALPGNDSTCEALPHAGVRLSGVSFRYDSDSADVLADFSHDFRPGSRTMIVGPTGAGKTTLIKLLLGLLKPDRGSIDIYGDDRCRPVSTATLCNFVYVPQGNSLLHGTIRDNLLLADPDADDSRLAEVLHTAAADFVFGLPLGLDTPCDEAGGGLSEGQAQRIAIARALLRPGSILLLDEFNSALDADTAATLMQRLDAACPDATIIIIAHHRTAIAPYCDTIVQVGT